MTPYSSATTAKMKSVCASGSTVLMVPSPGPRPRKPPSENDCMRAIDLRVVAGRRGEEPVDAQAHVREGRVGEGERPGAADGDDAGTEQRLPREEYSVAHTRLTSSVWPTSGSESSRPAKQRGHRRWRAAAPACRGACRSRRTARPRRRRRRAWRTRTAGANGRRSTASARAPLISGADEVHGDHAARRRRANSTSAEAAHAARREQRHDQHDQHADGGEEQVALDEVVGRQALADGDGRARRQRQHQPGADDREDGAEQHVVDREPPVGHTAAVGARQPHAAAPLHARCREGRRRARGRRRRAPRSCGTGRRRRRRATAARRARRAAPRLRRARPPRDGRHRACRSARRRPCHRASRRTPRVASPIR